MRAVLDVPRTLANCCHPDRMALVIYDMQAGIVGQIASGKAVEGRVGEILDVARAAGYPVIFTRHLSLPLRMMGRFQRRQAMIWQKIDDPDAIKPWFLPSSPGFEISQALAPQDDEAVIDKIAFSAFADTPLATIMRDLGLVSFAIMGIATEIGIAPTVSHGADLGFVPIVVRDACGAGHDAAGERSFEHMSFMGDAIMTDSGAFTAAMRAASR